MVPEERGAAGTTIKKRVHGQEKSKADGCITVISTQHSDTMSDELWVRDKIKSSECEEIQASRHLLCFDGLVVGISVFVLSSQPILGRHSQQISTITHLCGAEGMG